MNAPTYDHALVMSAREFAVQAHAGQTDDAESQVVHLDATVRLLMKMRASSQILGAAYLHTTLKLCPNVTYSDLNTRFGAEIADVVESCTGRGPTHAARLADQARKVSLSASAGRIVMAGRYCEVHLCCDMRDLASLKRHASELRFFSSTFTQLDEGIAAQLEAMVRLPLQKVSKRFALTF